MREVAMEHQNKFKHIHTQIEQSYKYFYENYGRYQKFMKFVYDTSLSADDVSKLIVLKKPNIEFNILEAYINRRVGEFAQHEPSLQVRAADGLSSDQIDENLVQTIEAVEGHIRYIIDHVSNDGLMSNIYKDTMGGGFSVAEVYTDYISDLSFEQSIHVERVFDPCLCGFDPIARKSHKGDGQYCFKITPVTKEEYEEEYGKESTVGMTFSRNVDAGSFNWSYMNQEQKILLIVDFFRKERKKETIVKLSTGETKTKKDYTKMLEEWVTVHQKMEQPPIVLEERPSHLETIWHYRLCENQVLAARKTNYKYLPLVFIDGNSAVIKRSREDATYQMTRPYVYQAEGVQRLKNFAGQSMASEIETMVQHKFIVSMEAIPKDYINAYTNPQQAQVLAYNAFYEKNPDMPLAPPQVIQRTDTPAIVQATFEGTDRVTQAILGSFDAQQGVVGDKISGRAIQQGAMQSDAAALPYLENLIKGLNRIGQILIDLIPKYYLTPRSMPIRKANGLRDYQVINDRTDPTSIDLNYNPESLQIKIEAGVNSAMQKQFALTQIIQLMDASQLFAQFMNTDGLEVLLDNIDIKGIEDLKIRAAKYMEGIKKAQEESQGQPDPMEMIAQAEMMKAQGEIEVEHERIEQKRQEAEGNLAIKSAQVAIDEQKAYNDFMIKVAELEEKQQRLSAEGNREASDVAHEAIRLAIDISKHQFETNNNESSYQKSEK